MLGIKPNFYGYSEAFRSVSFSSDLKHIASGSEDKTIRIWSVEHGTEIKKIEGHANWVNSVSFSKDGKYIISASSDKLIKIWTLEGNLVQ